MAFYDKHIEYLDLWEYGEKIGNVGFAKIEAREKECRIWISVKGLYQTDAVVGRLYLVDGEEEMLVDQFLLHFGMGTYAAKWETQNVAQVGMLYENWTGLKIKISEHRHIEQTWKKRIATEEEESEYEKEKMYRKESSETWSEPEKEKGIITEMDRDDRDDKDSFPQLRMNKWGRLGQYYKKKIPFGDGKEYLCISPEDLIVLPEKYEYLYKNSFLLHGYYAYGHLLLGVQQEQNRNTYKLFVPGLEHEKERLVAEMFGFGNFVLANTVQEKSPHGTNGMSKQSYGYYQMEVEL